MIPDDEIRSVLIKQFTIVYPFLVCRAAHPWCNGIAARGLGAAQGPRSQSVLDALRCILSLI